MSIQAVSYVLQRSAARRHDRLVLVSLANHANDRAESWPSVQTICHEAGISRRSVQRSLRRLQEADEISAKCESVGGRRSTTWVLVGFARLQGDFGAPNSSDDSDQLRKTHGNRGFNPRNRVGKVPKTPLGASTGRGCCVTIDAPAASISTQHPRQSDAPPSNG